MKRTLTAVVFTLLFASVVYGQGARAYVTQEKNVQEQLIALDKEWAAATARGDAGTISRILADDYAFTDLDGSVGTKADLLKDLKEGSAKEHPALKNDDYTVRVYGSTAVMTHRATAGNDHSAGSHLRSLHVWVKRGRSWQVVAHQWTTVTDPANRLTPNQQRLKCASYSFQPEVIAYFGDSSTVISKLDDDRMGLSDRRGYLLLIETKQSAEFSFFERDDDKHFRVYQWHGASLGDLREQLTNVILENRGIACIGAQTKSIVKARFNPEDLGTIPTPLSAQAAFSHALKKYGDQYLRVTVLLLC